MQEEPLYCDLEQDTFSTGSTQEDLSQHAWNIVDWDVKNQNKHWCRTKSDQSSSLRWHYPYCLVKTSRHYWKIVGGEVKHQKPRPKPVTSYID